LGYSSVGFQLQFMRYFFILLFFGSDFAMAQSHNKAKIESLLEFVKVEGGTFTMGNDSIMWDGVKLAPEHEVELSTFYIQTTEVTQELWEAVMGKNPSYFKTSARNPVTHVDWKDCQRFIKKLNSITGKKYRLPTEAEWEYAARGGNMSRGYVYAGSDDLNKVAWHHYNSGLKTHPVGQLGANELGLYDMSGNVSEWCSDWFGDYESKAQKNPKGSKKGKSRVVRGGSFYFNLCCQVTQRSQTGAFVFEMGLRLASSDE